MNIENEPGSKMEHLSAEKNENLERLKEHALPLDELYVSGLDNTEGKLTIGEVTLDFPANSWNEDLGRGVIVFADNEGKHFALPVNEQVHTLLARDAGLTRVDGRVPNINNNDFWHTDPDRPKNTSAPELWNTLTQRMKDDRFVEKLAKGIG
jgi:hypothetical protein